MPISVPRDGRESRPLAAEAAENVSPTFCKSLIIIDLQDQMSRFCLAVGAALVVRQRDGTARPEPGHSPAGYNLGWLLVRGSVSFFNIRKGLWPQAECFQHVVLMLGD